MSDNRFSSISRHIIRLLLGMFFIASAVLKLLSIDSFEIYIYSFGIINFTTTTFLSRLLIFTELVIGISLILKIYLRQFMWLTLLMMVGFTLFLIYAAIFRDDSNCHCFGSLIEINPRQSIFKNIIITALLFFIRNEKSHDYKPFLRKCLVATDIIISLIISFIIIPMDAIYNRIYSEKESVNTAAFYESINDSIHEELHHGRYLINYALAGCGHCRVGAEKLTLILDRHQIPHDRVKFVVGGNDEAIKRFIETTKTSDYEHWKIPAPEFIAITFGTFPLFVFIDDGEVVKAGDFRIIDDKTIEEFFPTDAASIKSTR